MATVDVLQSKRYGMKKLKKPQIREWVHPRTGDDYYVDLTPKKEFAVAVNNVIELNRKLKKRGVTDRYFTIAFDGFEYTPKEFKKKFKSRLNKLM